MDTHRLTHHSTESEKAIEKYLTERVKKSGGVCLKFASAIQTGYPDRIAVLPGGKVAWVELKSYGAKMTRKQVLRFQELTELGQNVYTADSKEQVDYIMEKITK